MLRLLAPCFGALLLIVLNGRMPAEEVGTLLDQLRSTKAQTGSPSQQRVAWEKLVKHGPEVLPRLLDAMDTPNTVAANWLHTAFDRIAEPALKEPA